LVNVSCLKQSCAKDVQFLKYESNILPTYYVFIGSYYEFGIENEKQSNHSMLQVLSSIHKETSSIETLQVSSNLAVW
jgi:hypothetical protein